MLSYLSHDVIINQLSPRPAGIFEAVGANPDGVYTAAAAGEVAFAYAKQQQLDVQAPDDRTLLLDPHLCDAL